MRRAVHKRKKNPVYLFCCEDEKSSRIYLSSIKREYGVNIHTVTSGDKRPKALRRQLNIRLKDYPKEDVKAAFCLFDKDDLSKEEFKKEVAETNKKYKAAVSVPCYEYWLLLHLFRTSREFDRSQECCSYLRDQINRQNSLDLSVEALKKNENIFALLGGKEGLKRAIASAKNFNFVLGDEPYTNMHEIIEGILADNAITP